MITHVEDATTFYAQYMDESAAAKLGEVMAALAEAYGSAAPEAYKPKKNETVACKFAADGQWYRVKVVRMPSEEDALFGIQYVDYGNTESVTAAALAVMPEAVKAIELSAQAVQMKLALIDGPSADYMEEGTELLSGGILNKVFSANVEYQAYEATAVTLTDEESSDDIAATMLSMGYASVNAKRKERGALGELQSQYKGIEADAKSNRQGMWMYGDNTEDPPQDKM